MVPVEAAACAAGVKDMRDIIIPKGERSSSTKIANELAFLV